jgi:16S rRNA (uracil1498-N3)-methyltransferase
MRRFFLPDFERPVLGDEEAHHATHVLRLKAGDMVTVFDGRGHEAQARIAEIGKDAVRLTLLQRTSTPAIPCRITLAQAVPKKNMDLIVQKATELGVAGIVPLISERTIKRPAARSQRWREIALEACKQSGNNWLPQIHPPQKTREFLVAAGNFDLKLIASLQPDARPLKQILDQSSRPEGRSYNSVLVLIGPEGDFTPAELAAARSAGCLAVTLGPLVLRAETAALYALSILHYELQSR